MTTEVQEISTFFSMDVENSIDSSSTLIDRSLVEIVTSTTTDITFVPEFTEMIQWINVDRSIVALISMSNESEEDQLNRINLQALQNRDPYITKILDQAQRVCVYKFLADKREWERKDLEGTLFVYERSCEPRHGFSILSTVSRETFVQILKASMEFKHSPNHDAFLQYKVDVGDIFGLWFISKSDCPRVTETLKNLTSEAKEREQTSLKTNSSSENSAIYSLLVNAQEKFQESKRQQDTNVIDPSISTNVNPLLRLFVNQEITNGSLPTTHEEREQELKKTLGIGAKSALSVTELEKQFLQAKRTPNDESTVNNARLMTPADFQSLINPFSKDTLRQLLVNMLQNDDEFLIELHKAYALKQARLHHF